MPNHETKIRKLWLKNPETGTIWDLLPEKPYNTNDGSALLDIGGFGYNQSVTQSQVETDYFISEILSSNKNITGTIYFNGDNHVENFQKYVGDFRRQFYLYYSPSGRFEPYDSISSIYYKPVIITQIGKKEKDKFGWYLCDVSLTTQSDVWKRDIYYSLSTQEIEKLGEALVYPYKYEYVYGGRDIYSFAIENDGRETGCIIKITNNSETPMSKVEWFIENTYVDYDGRTHQSIQRSAWYFQNNTSHTGVVLRRGYTLYVDSNPTTQEAKVIYPDETNQSVINWQEPSWDYINFIRIKHGQNKIVFYIESEDVKIEVIYQEQKELI